MGYSAMRCRESRYERSCLFFPAIYPTNDEFCALISIGQTCNWDFFEKINGSNWSCWICIYFSDKYNNNLSFCEGISTLYRYFIPYIADTDSRSTSTRLIWGDSCFMRWFRHLSTIQTMIDVKHVYINCESASKFTVQTTEIRTTESLKLKK